MPDFDNLAFPDAGCAQLVETAARDCAIESVVVYADRAEVKRRVPVSLAAGKNEVVVHGLSTCIDKNSIRSVDGKGHLDSYLIILMYVWLCCDQFICSVPCLISSR